MTEGQYREQFQALRERLAPYENIWNQEVLHLNWRLGAVYPESWLEPILKLTEEEAYLFDTGKQLPTTLPAELRELLKDLKELSQFTPNQTKEAPPINPKTFIFIKEKKVHELTRVLPLARAQLGGQQARIIDIGGGVGHLARALAFELGAKVTSVDGSSEFQALGVQRLKNVRWPAETGTISFACHYLGPQVSPEVAELFHDHNLSIGLHTCGNLALAQINHYLFSGQKHLINFGCCYNRLDPLQEINLSRFAQTHPLPFSPYALSLATRGYAKLNLKDYQLKKRVKTFRYGLHFLLERHYGIEFPDPVGECHTRIYWGPFHVYAKQKIAELGHDLKHSDDQLDHFITEVNVKQQIELMIAGDLIRWQMGRAIESYLLLDRALYLMEHQKDVQLVEVFDEVISPRNIALIATAKGARSPDV